MRIRRSEIDTAGLGAEVDRLTAALERVQNNAPAEIAAAMQPLLAIAWNEGYDAANVKPPWEPDPPNPYEDQP
jgi:hypothetical protein